MGGIQPKLKWPYLVEKAHLGVGKCLYALGLETPAQHIYIYLYLEMSKNLWHQDAL